MVKCTYLIFFSPSSHKFHYLSNGDGFVSTWPMLWERTGAIRLRIRQSPISKQRRHTVDSTSAPTDSSTPSPGPGGVFSTQPDTPSDNTPPLSSATNPRRLLSQSPPPPPHRYRRAPAATILEPASSRRTGTPSSCRCGSSWLVSPTAVTGGRTSGSEGRKARRAGLGKQSPHRRGRRCAPRLSALPPGATGTARCRYSNSQMREVEPPPTTTGRQSLSEEFKSDRKPCSARSPLDSSEPAC